MCGALAVAVAAGEGICVCGGASLGALAVAAGEGICGEEVSLGAM